MYVWNPQTIYLFWFPEPTYFFYTLNIDVQYKKLVNVGFLLNSDKTAS